jgi:hypothetical protein
MDEFRTSHHVQLVSSASQDKYDNATASFTTLLANPLVTDGTWEVGLVNCSYHHNIVNVSCAVEAKFRVTLSLARESFQEAQLWNGRRSWIKTSTYRSLETT